MSLYGCPNFLTFAIKSFVFSLLSSRCLEENQVPQDLDVEWS